MKEEFVHEKIKTNEKKKLGDNEVEILPLNMQKKEVLLRVCDSDDLG